MSEYKAPLRDMHFVLQELAGLAEVAKLPGLEEINAELVDQILEESAKFASGVLSPLTSPPTRRARSGTRAGSPRPRASRRRIGSSWKAGGTRCRRPPSTADRGCPRSSRRPSSRCGNRR